MVGGKEVKKGRSGIASSGCINVQMPTAEEKDKVKNAPNGVYVWGVILLAAQPRVQRLVRRLVVHVVCAAEHTASKKSERRINIW